MAESLSRASVALAIVSVAGVLSVAACGVVGGGSDDAADTSATGVHRSERPSTQPSATTGVVPSPGAASPAGVPLASPADVATITELTRTVVVADKVGDICREKLSAKFVMTVYKTVTRCERKWIDKDDTDHSDDATGVSLSNIRVSGSAATAAVTLHGGDSEGITGTWAYLRAGDRWRIAAWGVDFLRSNWTFTNYKADGPADPLGYPVVQSCLTNKFAQMSDAGFESFAYAVARDDKAAILGLQQDVMTCARVPDAEGVSTLRRLFEIGVRKGLKKTGADSDAAFACVTQRLRKSVSDDEIAKGTAAWEKTGVYPPEMLHKAFRAGYDCAAELAKVPATRST
jgi:hypothetical protein